MYSAIFGLNPSAGAKSPVIWNYLYGELGIDGEMVCIDCDDPTMFLEKLSECMKDREFVGGAIAAPYKEVATKAVSGSPDKGGPVNCIYRSGASFGVANTDAIACYEDMLENGMLDRVANITILGFGGTGKALASELDRRLARDISICVCSRNKPGPERSCFGGRMQWRDWEERYSEANHSDLIINCTSMGDTNNIGQNPLDASRVDLTGKAVYDVVYQPEDRPLISQLTEQTKCMSGTGMNRRQALIAFSLCHGDYSVDLLGRLLHKAAF